MSKAEQVREYLRKNPNSTARAIAAAEDIDIMLVSKTLSYLHQRERASREVHSLTLSGTPVYAYTLTSVEPVRRGRPSKGASSTRRAANKTGNHGIPKITPGENLESLIQTLASSLVTELVNRVKAQLPAALSAALPAPSRPQPTQVDQEILTASSAPSNVDVFQLVVTDPTTVTKPAKFVKPRIAVVGLLPVQAGELVSWLGASVDLVFWDRGGDKGKLRNIAETCEVVFLHTRHAGHSTDQLLKAYRANIRRVTGALSNMKVAIKGYFEEKEKAT